MQQYDYRRRAWGYAVLFLLLLCLADTGIAQSAPTVSISLAQRDATAWEGGTIRFRVEIDRPLEADERLDVLLKYEPAMNVPTEGAGVSIVRGGNRATVSELDIMQQGNDPPVFNTTITFVGAGARTATLRWRFGNDNVLDGDRVAQIVIDDIESNNISPTPIPDPDNATLTVTVWEDEYIIDFNKGIYVIDEEENAELILRIRGNPGDKITNSGLRASDRVMFRYTEGTSAVARMDYMPIYSFPDFLTIPPSTTSFVVEIPIVHDAELESNELFRVTIDRDNPPQIPGDNGLKQIFLFAEVVIRDDDDVRVTITAPRTVIAGNPAIFTITRTLPPNSRSFPVISLDSALTMALEAVETNEESKDYVPSVTSTTEVVGMITIPVGETMVTYSIPTVDDGSGRSSSRLTVRIDGSSFMSSITLPGNPSPRVIVGNPEGVSLSVVPRRAIVFIRSKVFLEGPLQ